LPFSVCFLFAFFCLPFVLFSQASKEIKGRVVAKDKDVTGVVVQNITTERATITDLDGSFSIQIAVNDTLVFSAIQFKRKILQITTAVYNASYLTIPLEEFVNELKEVT